MPTYEYQCPEGHLFEKFQKMSDKPRANCPTCGKPAIRKISGGAGLVFKGSGFYITDYGKDGKGPRKPETEASSSADAKPAGESKADSAKPDTKPAAKADSAPAKSSSRQGKGKAASE
jgi:putative FmdB family regulatory protein